MDNEARLLLDDAIACCQRDGLDARLINMLASARALTLTEDALTIEAPSRFAYSYLVKQRDVIERYLSEIAFAQLALNVTVPSAPAGTPTSRTKAVPTAAEGSSGAPEAADTAAPTRHAGPLLADTREAADRKINVTKTMSEADFRTMMERMKQDGGGSGAGSAAPAPASAAPETPSAADDTTEYPSVGVNSKFTFDNFVLGDENRHAYQSAARFAAFADEPGQCTSLFIYGNSGLGKTHLLFAIKNYLAAEKPYIRVKYANSQAYIDDYMRDLGAQRGPGEPIMREYRTADVLIIDDIQNIIGRQASIEFFFQLVDEFIRENKKIVIASDRAPKKLGMDERLTSRFNSGMLCLVSEPSFETKYRILKYYYENIICSTTSVPASAGDLSILDGIALEEGKLTDDHLRHMAEISGNNIRELESFCERCAGLSYEKEQAGRELTATDIDAIADEYFDTAHKVVRVETIQSVVEEFYHVSHEDMIGRKRSKNIVFPRHVATYLVNSMCEMSLKAVGAAFGRDHTTVIHSIEKVETKMKEDARFKEEIQQLKNIILIKS